MEKSVGKFAVPPPLESNSNLKLKLFGKVTLPSVLQVPLAEPPSLLSSPSFCHPFHLTLSTCLRVLVSCGTALWLQILCELPLRPGCLEDWAGVERARDVGERRRE